MPIKDRQMENGTVRYYLIQEQFFDSLYSLICYYQTHSLRSTKFSITLGRAVPPPNQHEDKVKQIIIFFRIDHQSYKLYICQTTIKLKFIVSIIFKAWFHSNVTREKAEEMIQRVPSDGAFLVRPGERIAGSYAITFR